MCKTESWNGSVWTEVADLATARYVIQDSVQYTSINFTGGEPGPSCAITEEWSFPP